MSSVMYWVTWCVSHLWRRDTIDVTENEVYHVEMCIHTYTHLAESCRVLHELFFSSHVILHSMTDTDKLTLFCDCNGNK